MQRCRPCVTALGLLLASACAAQDAPVAGAPDLDYTVGVQVEYNDNINLSHDDAVGGTILSPQLAFDYHKQGATLTALAAGAAEYDEYLGGAPYSSYLRGVFSGSADWSISPGRLDWVAEDHLGRQPVSVLASETPSNQQQTNVFSSGPTLRARLGSALRGQLDVRYINTWADQTSDFNSNRLSALGRLAWLLDAEDTLSVAATDLRVRYNADASQPFDYDRNDAYLNYTRRGRHVQLDISAGYTWLDLRAQPNRAGSLLDATVRWTPSVRNNVALTLKRQFADASEALLVEPNEIGALGVGTSHNNAVISPQLYVEKLARLQFNHAQGRLHVGVDPFWRRIDYFEGNLLSQHSQGVYAHASWLLRPHLSLLASTGFEHRRYTDVDRRDNDSAYSLGLLWQHSRHWLMSLRASHLTRSSDPAQFGYSDNAIVLALLYQR